MKVFVSFEIRFKTNQEKVLSILKHFGFNGIQKNLYFADIDFDELFLMKSQIMENIREYDSILVFPVCKSCYEKANVFGKNLKFQDDLYKIF